MAVILGLGVVWIALGLLVMVPLALGIKHEYLAMAFQDAFQVCLTVGFLALILFGLLLWAVPPQA